MLVSKSFKSICCTDKIESTPKIGFTITLEKCSTNYKSCNLYNRTTYKNIIIGNNVNFLSSLKCKLQKIIHNKKINPSRYFKHTSIVNYKLVCFQHQKSKHLRSSKLRFF